MPADGRIQILQFGLLLLCVPAQYLISKYYTASDGERVYALRTLYSKFVWVREKYLSPVQWVDWCLSLIRLRRPGPGPGSQPADGRVWSDYLTSPGDEDGEGESPALEVLAYRQQQEEENSEYFGRSIIPRDSRSPEIKYRVGQVVKHVYFGYRGVIIGWDKTAQAPREWIDQNHPDDKPGWKDQPNYAILVDTRDRIAPQVTYVPQENIQLIGHTQQIFNPLLDVIFESFDSVNNVYVGRPWLRKFYPYD